MTLSFANLGSIREIGSGDWSSAQLAGAIIARASVLAQMGIGHQSTVALVHGNSAQFFIDLLAVWATGATAACLDPALTERELKTVIAFLDPEAVLCGENSMHIDEDVKAVCLWDVLSATEEDIAPEIAGSGNPALILFTSGTTSDPKGVVLGFDAIATRIGLNISEIGKKSLARTLLTLPTHFGHGLIGNALTPLFSGGELVIPAPETALHKDLGNLLETFGITFLTSVPALWRLAMKFGDAPQAGSLLRVHVGSAPLTLALWRDIAQWSGATVFNCYGMTETANWISGASCLAPDLCDGLVGKPWGGTAAVLAPDGTISSAGHGEILLRSPSWMTGYLRAPELTKRACHGDWFRTGDTGRIMENGAIVLAGRLKDEINRAGFKVQPAEVDALLGSNAAVEEACAFGLPDAVSGEIVAVAVKLAPASMETQASLRRWCLDRARRELVPERWFFVEKIPVTSRGKTDRDKVRKYCVEEHPASRHRHDTAR